MRGISKLDIHQYLIGQNRPNESSDNHMCFLWLILILEYLMPHKVSSKSGYWKSPQNTMLFLFWLLHPVMLMNFSIKLFSISSIDFLLFIKNNWWCTTILSKGHFKIRHSRISNWSVLTKWNLWQSHRFPLTYTHFRTSNAT